MNAVKHEVEGEDAGVVWQPVVFAVEEEPVQIVLSKGPPEDAKTEGTERLQERQSLELGVYAVNNWREIEDGY